MKKSNFKDKANETKQTVSGMSEEVVNIYKNANEQRRQLSEEEKQIAPIVTGKQIGRAHV